MSDFVLTKGMKVRTKPLNQCSIIGNNRPADWDHRCFDVMAIVHDVNYSEATDNDGTRRAYGSLIFDSVGQQYFFHDWIVGPECVSGPELMDWIRKERRGGS